MHSKIRKYVFLLLIIVYLSLASAGFRGFSFAAIQIKKGEIELTPTSILTGETNSFSGTRINEAGAVEQQRERSLTYFSQRDPNYGRTTGRAMCASETGGRPFVETIEYSGCGPVSVAMILSGYKDKKITPLTVWNDYVEAGQTYCGTRLTSHINYLRENGFTVSSPIQCAVGNVCITMMDNFLKAKQGRVLLMGASLGRDSAGKCSRGGHYFLVSEIKNGIAYIYDPYYGYGKPSHPVAMDQLGWQCVAWGWFIVIDTK